MRVSTCTSFCIFVADRKGVSSVEFAILSPVFIGILFGIITFGLHVGAANSLQQLCNDVARATVAGVNEAERAQLAEAFLAENADRYVLLKREYLTIDVADNPARPQQFDVMLEYDASHLPTVVWSDLFRRPEPVIRSVATIRHGGY